MGVLWGYSEGTVGVQGVQLGYNVPHSPLPKGGGKILG